MPLTEEERNEIIENLKRFNLSHEQIATIPFIGNSNEELNAALINSSSQSETSERNQNQQENTLLRSGRENLFLKPNVDLLNTNLQLSHEKEIDSSLQVSSATVDSKNDSEISSIHLASPSVTYGKSSNPAATSDSEIIYDIRGDIRTYEIDMMGGFNFIISGSNIEIDPESKIRRPINITGFLGSVAGDHVISLALFVNNMMEDIKEKNIHEAISDLIGKVRNLGQDYSSFVEEAKKFTDNSELTLQNQLEGFNFLKSKLIPGITAVWNQKVGSAFHSNKSNKERGKEGAMIRKLLGETSGDINNEVIKLLVKGIDYKPVSTIRSITSSDAHEKLYEGLRTNNYTTLSYVLGEVAEYYVVQYNQDPSQNAEITKKFLAEFFKQNPQWVKHFQKHPKDFGQKRINALKSLYPLKYKSNEDIKKLNSNDLSKLIITDISKGKPSLMQQNTDEIPLKRKFESRDEVTAAKKPALNTVDRLQNYLRSVTGDNRVIVENVKGEGDCFFLSVSKGMTSNLSEKELDDQAFNYRTLAVNYMRARVEEDHDDYVGRLLQHIQAPDIDGATTFDDPESYLNNMAQVGTFADQPVIQALSDILQVKIYITDDQGRIRPVSPREITSTGERTRRSALKRVHVGYLNKNHYVAIKGVPKEYGSNNLVRSEKIVLKQEKQAKPKFINILTEDLSELEKELIGRLKTEKETEVTSTKTTAQKTSLKPQITFMAENDHKVDHRDNTAKLIAMVNANQIDSNTVICLERKEEGKNFGMRDVRLLARLLEHNQANPESMVPINEQVQKSPIYQDAMLYNVAKEKGIQVIGVEGKGLKHAKESPEYNSTREDYIASQITKIIASGKNVIFPVGASHIDGLKSKFPDALDMVVSINEERPPEISNVISSELKQEMSQLKKPSSYILVDTTYISSPKVTPILYKSKLSNLTK